MGQEVSANKVDGGDDDVGVISPRRSSATDADAAAHNADSEARKVQIQASEVEKLQAATHFDRVEAKELFRVFMSLTNDGKDELDKETFAQGLSRLEEAGLANLHDSPFADRLFVLLDVDGNGKVDLKEFVTGLSLLCKGTAEEKLELSFKAYDLDQNGSIDKSELAAMFKAAWLSGYRALSTEKGIGTDEDVSQKEVSF